MPVVDSARGASRSYYSSQPSAPQGLVDAQRAQRQANPRPVTIGGREMDLGATSARFLAAGSLATTMQRLAASRDAAVGAVVAQNADLWVLRFSYHTHKPMEAWLTSRPPGDVLKINVACTPSWHVGSTSEEKRRNGEAYARNNSYSWRVRYPDGTTKQGTFGIKNPPEYASASDTIEIDLKKKGKITIDVWPSSTSVGGYIEARSTVLHNE